METQTSTFKKYTKFILVIFAITVTLTSFMYAFSSSAQDAINEQLVTKLNEEAQNSVKWQEADKEIVKYTELIDVQAKIQNKAVADNLIVRNQIQALRDQLANSYKTPARRGVAPSPSPKSQPTE